MEEVDGVNLVAVKGVFGVGGGENEAHGGRQLAGNIHACHAVHFDIEEHEVGFLFYNFLQSYARIGVGLEGYAPEAVAVVPDNAQGYRLVVYGYGVEHDLKVKK